MLSAMDQLAGVMFCTVALATINARYLNWQRSIALTSGALLLSFVVLAISESGLYPMRAHVQGVLQAWPFNHLVLDVMLGYLLYAGAIHLNVRLLKNFKWEILILALLSTLISTGMIGTLTYTLGAWLGHPMTWLSAAFFGALISPTDPIAVLASLKQLKAPPSVAIKVAGESLFNDGVGVVVFMTLMELSRGSHGLTGWHVLAIFARQALGGIAWGGLLGALSMALLAGIGDVAVAVFLTLAVVAVGYPLAEHLGVSGPLAMVVAGMFISHLQTGERLSRRCKQSLVTFWEVIDELLNAVLFLLLGFELLVVDIRWQDVWLMLTIIPAVLLVRYVTVGLPLRFFPKRHYHPSTVPVLTWGGLRGGLAVALALAVPASVDRRLILVLTYGVVLFSVLVQGNTVHRVIANEED